MMVNFPFKHFIQIEDKLKYKSLIKEKSKYSLTLKIILALINLLSTLFKLSPFFFI